ncbi:MAG: cytotoxic translational repressor of toxin-antitoxin stability system [Gammaproteobacteria bacterium CG11_big_fil_rev_8_21_14_0_20_46_22]|nr:MAG: cytotoxic translational repressor of toxin-antitoxin stability system [Gammaproteobacteria bacterium CG12_big_fil_rev_8_21_14_0_65_46_12]PIR11697.1 MAG: cytotoxic translational repressor of toxin-antitoxin stability system [Gammaproteobacteria bacterium CG11_big_fil_rev_8_21_14_0_20_46_22]
MNTENWKVTIHRRATKQIRQLPVKTQKSLYLLVKSLELDGPNAGKQWKNFGKLRNCSAEIYHCHLSKGRPRYVCCWELKNKALKLLEILYVGTHEKAPY